MTEKTYNCKQCGKEFNSTRTDQVYCNDVCLRRGLKRPTKPSCKQLMDCMAKHKTKGEVNWSAVGREYSTTSKTVHIWAEQYALVPVKFYLGKIFY